MEGRFKSTPVVGDINKDGFIDVAAHIRLAKGAQVWLGSGAGTWRNSSKGLAMDSSCGGGLQLADVNGDGNLDLVVADHCSGVHVYLGDGKGNWQMVTEKLESNLARTTAAEEGEANYYSGKEAAAVGDINADGFMDLIACASDRGGFTAYLGDGTGRNWKEIENSGLPAPGREEESDVEGTGWCNDMHLVDMNGDGRLDVVSGYYTGPRVWRGDGKGHFESYSTGLTRSRLGGVYRKTAIGDINGDGRPDLAVANVVNGVEAYLQRPDGTWTGPIDVMPELKGGATAVALGDMDGDGKLDAVIGGQLARRGEGKGHGLYVRVGDGKGGFADAPGTNLPQEGLEIVWGIALVNIGDRRPDIVIASGGDFGKPATPRATPPGRPPATADKGTRAAPASAPPQQVAGGAAVAGVPKMQVWRSLPL
jgi:hypothetical protein